MNTTRIRRLLAYTACGGALAAAALSPAPQAHADPVGNYAAINAGPVCETLDDYPTVGGVTGVLSAVMKDSGFTAYQAGQVVGAAVAGWCPRHLALLGRFVAIYGDHDATAANFGPVLR